MCLKIHLSCFLILLFTYSCTEKTATNARPTQSVSPKNPVHYLISSSGDSLLTGEPIPSKGKRLNPDSVAAPKIIPIRGAPHTFPAYNNIRPAGQPKVVEIPDELLVITPGKDSIPMPETLKANSTVVPAFHPAPVRASKLQMEELAARDIRYLDVELGLSVPLIWSTLEDSKGNLWFGTIGGGLSKYDGTYFTHYTEKEGLSNSIIWSLCEDSKGNIWIGTRGGGLTKFDGHSFTHFTTEGGLINNNIFTLLEDSKGDLWIGTNGGGVSRFDGATFTHYTEANGLGHNDVLSLFEDRQGKLWIGTGGGIGGLSCFDGSGFTRYTTAEGLSHPDVWSIEEDGEGNLWFATFGGGVNRFDGKSFAHYTQEEGLFSNSIVSSLKDSRGNLWFGSWGEGVSRFDGTHFTHYTEKDGLTSLNILSILEDKRGYIWFGTIGGGVNRLDEDGFQHHAQITANGPSTVSALTEDKVGNIWFSTSSGGLSQYNGEHISNYHKEQGLSGSSYTSVVEDLEGKFWLLDNSIGVGHFDPSSGESGTITFYTQKEGLTDHQIESILVDRKNNLWCGSQRKGVTRFDGRDFTHFSTKEGLSNNTVESILEDSQGNIWFGTFGGGLSRYDGESFINYTTNEGLIHNYVRNMLEDSQGVLWVCTVGGLSRFDGTSFSNFTTDNGLNSNNTFSIVEDHNHNLWVNTDRGLTVFKPIAEDSAIATQTDNQLYQPLTFGSTDGLNKVAFKPFPKGLLSQQNQIWWGCSNGLKKLDLNQYDLPDAAPENVQLTHIEVDQQFVDYRRLADTAYQNEFPFGQVLSNSFDSIVPFQNYPLHLSLPYHLNHLSFSFSATDWQAPQQVHYSFLLENYDQNWSVPHPEPKAEYRNLPHGTFTLQIKAIGVAQVWSKPFSYTFTIRPPWWQTWWAYTFYALVAFASVYRVYRFQLTRKLEQAEARQAKVIREKNEQLEQAMDHLQTTQQQLIMQEKMASLGQMTAGIAHEIKNPLNFVNNLAELSVEMTDELKEELERYQNSKDPEDYAGVLEVLGSLQKNAAFIQENGQRADGIVSSMMDHANTSQGERVRTDLNALVEEYVKLAYHGYKNEREKAKINIQQALAAEIPEIVVNPRDIGRVLINLINNACDAVIERANREGHPYQPVIQVGTELVNEYIEIRIRDNGIGIPDAIRAQIFTPFFTTKPTGQGSTGLGLSISYDIIHQGHQGKLSFECEEGSFTAFVIALPIANGLFK
ncbi:MAG: hypothetical protein HRU41_40000 [Saprospiraceae bacterium]|nr:hypothetical protein [Saprospiraceae bacterium]